MKKILIVSLIVLVIVLCVSSIGYAVYREFFQPQNVFVVVETVFVNGYVNHSNTLLDSRNLSDPATFQRLVAALVTEQEKVTSVKVSNIAIIGVYKLK